MHRFLSEDSYWAKNIPREVVERSIRHSLCFTIRKDDELADLARVTSDRAMVAYVPWRRI